MVAFINKMSGGLMYVHESRVEEYLAAGHKLAAAPRPAGPPKAPARKRTTKSTTK